MKVSAPVIVVDWIVHEEDAAIDDVKLNAPVMVFDKMFHAPELAA